MREMRLDNDIAAITYARWVCSPSIHDPIRLPGLSSSKRVHKAGPDVLHALAHGRLERFGSMRIKEHTVLHPIHCFLDAVLDTTEV